MPEVVSIVNIGAAGSSLSSKNRTKTKKKIKINNISTHYLWYWHYRMGTYFKFYKFNFYFITSKRTEISLLTDGSAGSM